MANSDASSLHIEVKKELFLFAEASKNRRKFKISIERINIHLTFISFFEIRLFNALFWERKAGFGKLMKNVRDARFTRKRGGNAGSGLPLPDPE